MMATIAKIEKPKSDRTMLFSSVDVALVTCLTSNVSNSFVRI